MNQSITISRRQLSCILINSIAVKLFLTFPREMVINSGNAAWIQGLYVTVCALVIYKLTTIVYDKCGKRDILDVCDFAGGAPLRIIAGVLLCVLLVLNVSMTVRIFPESIKIYLLPDTPVEFSIFILGITAVLGAFFGIEAIARLHSIFVPVAGIVAGVFFLCVLPYCKIDNLLPVFGTGAKNIFIDGFGWVSIFVDIIILNILLPYCENKYEAKTGGYIGIIAGGLSGAVILLVYCMIYPYPASADFLMPVYQIMRMIRIGDFFQRVESVFEFVWAIGVMMYISLYVFVISALIQKAFGLKYYKPLLVPVMAVIYCASYMSGSMAEVLFREQAIKNIIYPVAYALPVAAGIVFRIKNRGTDR